MAFTNADLLAIKDELTNDPKSLGLTTNAADDAANAVKLNTEQPTLLIDREAIPTSEIYVQIDRDEYAALALADRQWLDGVGQSGVINPKDGGEVREGLLQLFGAGTETRTNLLSILQESTHRIEQMFKEGLLSQGGNITASDVANARNAT